MSVISIRGVCDVAQQETAQTREFIYSVEVESGTDLLPSDAFYDALGGS